MRLTDYEILFDLPEGECDPRGMDGVRTATWRAGRSLEVVCYPITRISREAKREARRRQTSPAMARINARNTERHIMRLVEANFTPAAVVVTGTYAYPVEDFGMCDLKELSAIYGERKLPWEMERVRMDVRNWLGKLRRWVTKAGGRPGDFKWLVRIEEGKDPPGVGLPPKYHFHAIVEGPGLDRAVAQAKWEERHGRCHCDMLALEDGGAARLAKYFTKQKSGGRWWSHSRNLKIIRPTVSDRRMSRRRMARVAEDVRRNGREIFEKLYPGYRVVELPEPRYSDYVTGAYIYCRMRRRD